jgi:hypothetical protein
VIREDNDGKIPLQANTFSIDCKSTAIMLGGS